jgi:ABC-2 type transport system ATP-binding protein
MVAAVEVTDLVKRYGAITAVDGLTLRAEMGQVTAVLGPNGAGKTSTIEVCEGLRTLDGGSVTVLGRRPGDRELRHRVGVMPQQTGSYPGARCGEMLRLIASYFADPIDPDALLETVGLTSAARRPFRRLSGGEKQRLSLAMALVGRPELVFLDEPSAGLDVQARHLTWDLIRALRADGVSVVLTTHDMDEAATLADQIVIIDHGRLLAAGSVADLTRGAGDRLRFDAPPGLDVATLNARLPAGTAASEPAPGSYRVDGTVTPDVLALVTAWTAELGAMPRDLRTGGNSLEDVFLALTGREIRS